MLYEPGDLYEGLASGVPRASVLASIRVWLAWGSSYDDVELSMPSGKDWREDGLMQLALNTVQKQFVPYLAIRT